MFSPGRFTALLGTVVLGAALLPSTPVRADADDLTVFAGTGGAGASGDGGPAANATLNHPTGVAVAADGTVYLSDGGNHTVRAVSPAGTITTVAGTGRAGVPGRPVPDGVRGTGFDLVLPTSLAVGPDNVLYIADSGLFRVLALTPDGRLSVVAGDGRRGGTGDRGPATEATLGQLGGLAVGPDRTVYLGETDNGRVRAVTPDGVITTVAGNGGTQVTAAGGPATAVPVPAPASLAVDGDGAVWIGSGLLVHRLSGGRVATVVRTGGDGGGGWGLAEDQTWPPARTPVNNVSAVAAGPDGIYLLDQQDRTVRRLGAGDAVTEVATLPSTGGPAAGPVAVGASGTAYLVDSAGNRVYAFLPSAAPAPETDRGGLPWWPFVAGAAVLVLLGGWVTRRLRRNR
ncbi:hypothetical protein [Plantactinospora sp. B5E13]|uniref:NHL domain-containing protein n=1 Tax=unclassified Plantactinospora TaxID=2631981 RepID=UPI00325E56EA